MIQPDKLYCQNCQKEQQYEVIEKSNQKTAWCNECQSYIKNISYVEPAFFFGKHKGKLVSEVEDYDYLRWFTANVKGNKRLKAAIDKKIYG